MKEKFFIVKLGYSVSLKVCGSSVANLVDLLCQSEGLQTDWEGKITGREDLVITLCPYKEPADESSEC